MNFRKLITYLTMGTAAAMPLAVAQNPTILQGSYISNVFGNSNFVLNPNAQTNVANVTNATRSTTTPLVATSEFTLSLASGANATWTLRAFDGGMKGQNCEARFTYRGFATATTKAEIVQNSLVVASLTLTPTTDPRIASINFPCGDLANLTTFRIAQTTANMTGTNEIGGIYVGLATNMANVAQAEAVVFAYRNSAQTIASGSDTKIEFDTKTLDVYGEFTTSGADIGVFTAKRSGTYQIVANALFNNASWTANQEVYYVVKKNGTAICSTTKRLEASVTSFFIMPHPITCNIPVVVGDKIRADIYHNAGTNRDLFGGATYTTFQVSRFPSSSELVVTPERQNVFAGLKGSANASTNIVTTNSWTKLTSSASLTRTAYGKAKIEANNDYSITIENLPVGSYQVIATSSFTALSGAAAERTVCYFGIADTATGGTQIAGMQISATGDTSAVSQYILNGTLQGIYQNTAVANRTFFIQANRGSGSGSCSSYADSFQPLTITVIPLDQPSNSALYVEGPVKASATGAAIPSGYQGYTVESTLTGTTTPTNSNQWYTTESVSLTPGVWSCYADSAFYYSGAGNAPTGFTSFTSGICSGVNCTPASIVSVHGANTTATGNGVDFGAVLNNSRIFNVSATTTYYLSSKFTFTARNALVIDNNSSTLRCTLLN